ncbi:MAG: HAMP domain-containing protein [Bacteroidetes bacterium]|nr:HAMP domain-containing protein [Bacteroidota bacterium]
MPNMDFKLQEKGLAFKLILYIFSSIAFIFSVIFLYNYGISKNIVEKNLKLNAEALTMSAVLKSEKVLSSVQKITDNFARILMASDYSMEVQKNLLRQIVENNEEIYGATLAFEPYYFDSTQKYYAPYYFHKSGKIAYMNLDDEQYDYFSRDWYQIPKMLNRTVWSEPYYDDGAGDVVMSTYSVPLYKNIHGQKQFFGILTADISQEWLQDFINSIKVFQTGYGFMISSNGTIVTHPDKRMIMNETIFSVADEQKSPQLRIIGQNMIHGKKSFAEIEYRNVKTGKLSWIAYAPIALNGWSIGIVFPVDEFMADVNNLYVNLIFLGLGGLLIILIVIILISRSITSPLRRLTHAAAQFAQGDFNVQLPIIKSKDEIGKLNTSFIVMQDALAATISDLREASEKLKISNEKLEEYNRTLEQKVEIRTAELKDKNKELDKAFNNVRTLNEIGKEITSTLDIALIQEMIFKHANSLLDATSFLVMLYDEKEQQLICNLSMEKGEKLPSFEVSMADKNRFAVWCVDHASPVFMNDVENEYMKYVSHRAKPQAGETVSSLIYLPLIIEKRVLGVISAQSFQKNAYSQYQFDMLSNLANFVAIAIENALAYEKINKANSDLKAAQAQLVQSEKMASLGQLTAGIAHEIKNPLNFVTNFSELTVDLANELNEEIEKLADHLQEADKEFLLEITSDILSNSQKINDHGKRADSIVRGMLLHSRGKSGDIQPSDINALLAEYVNLGYHGMRAQDPSFNVKIDAEYDASIGLINVVPQNLSRVFLNIINNACYSTNLKKQKLKEAYFPILTIRTKNETDKVEILIRDNGNGIPRDIIDKVFNPFFTTKPPGKGTGLGLSLSYDIVVQEHHGEMKVDSKDGEFAEFLITIPKNLK